MMDVAARLSSKGQITVPKPVRDALDLHEGDRVYFRVQGRHAVLGRSANLLDLAGSVPVPTGKEGASIEEIRAQTRKRRAARSR